MSRPVRAAILVAVLVLGALGPFLAPNYVTQLAFLWVMVILSLTWDLVGGQMGYNSFGNILFFGIGAYAAAVVQRGGWAPGYFPGLALGTLTAVALAAATAVVLGSAILRLRGHYFAICTLGLGVAAGEIASGWDYVGAGSGMVPPVFPGAPDSRGIFFYYFFAVTALVCFLVLRWLYTTRFGLAINAIRDDEDKAEAMGLRTTWYKTAAWTVSAVFLAVAGAGVGHLIGFIDPRQVAFAGETYGVWMVLMAILGGSGTLWGPVIGAVVFHVTQEFFWTYFLGFQRIALGLLIVLIVVFFPQGILGFLRDRWPRLFDRSVSRPPGAAASASGVPARGGDD
jgi:branched-chain amino acid transport system permease protein